MAQPCPHLGPDPYALLEWVDVIADRFEASWNNGQTPSISNYLADTVGEKRTTLVRELAKIDLERRVRAGENKKWDDYVREFPELQAVGDDIVISIPRGDTLVAPLELKERLRGAASRPQVRKWPAIEGYEILAELGHGGMGSVYKARQLSLKRVVALKVIRSAAQTDPRHLARFQTEAEAAARLQHPNIAQIYEVGHQDGVPHIAMEYLGGGSLAQALSGKPQPPRQAAELVATLARAMQYAHERGVIHRDLKPANVLLQNGLDSQATRGNRETTRQGDGAPPSSSVSSRFPALSSHGRPIRQTSSSVTLLTAKITDFGLAKLQEDESGQTVSGAIMGTPSYMAPEQAQGSAGAVGPASDTYALGAILYEMLTGGPPFKGASVLETLEQVRSAEPVPPSRLVKVPRDLETICLKALARAPGSRYATAAALAEDLGRFLDGKPIRARPVGLGERLWRWGRRRPALAGLIATASALLITVVASSVIVALASTAQEKARRREGLIHQLQLVRATAHVNGWSDKVWSLATEAAALRKDTTLRTLAAACAGLDARAVKRLEKASVSWVTFDPEGRRLLLGGRNDGRGKPLEGAKVWDLDSNRLEVSRKAGPGPVAFGRHGEPLHLVMEDGGAATLWGLADQKSVSKLRLGTAEFASPALELNELDLPVLTLSRGGTIAAAAITGSARENTIVVWDARSGHVLFRSNRRAGALAVSANGNLLATGDAQGHIGLWTIPEGKSAATFEMGRMTIHSLSFSPDGKRLAVGDSAGAVTIWDVNSRIPVTYCQGSHEDVYALAFNPDGTLIASGGRGPVRLWDAATGRLVLSLRTSSVTTALAFAPDGRRIVVGHKAPALAVVWELDWGTGIQTLRGLTSQASHVCFSDDGRLLAALAHNCQIAIWDVGTGHMLRVLPAPQGNADDDAALAFSPGGHRFACSAGEGAKLWDVTTGQELGSWHLPAGARDALAFRSSGALLLFRQEQGNSAENKSMDEPESAERVCRIRNLLGPAPSEPLATLAEFNRHLLDAVATPDGSAFVAEGVHQGTDGQRRTVRAYDSLTGTERWAIPSTRSQLVGTLALDPTGGLLALEVDNRHEKGDLAEVATGELIGKLEPFPMCLGPQARNLVRFGTGDVSGDGRGYALFQRGDSLPRLVLGIDTTPAFRPVFSRDGNLLAWSNSDGTVSVCDLPRLRNRLSEVGLDW